MRVEMKYTVFPTPVGWIGLLASDDGLRGTTLPQPAAEAAQALLGPEAAQAEAVPGAFAGLIDRFQAYFQGQRVAFDDRLDLSTGTPFQQAVWAATRRIGYGETRTYRWVAGQMGRPLGARAVGQALGANPLPLIIPCHRVIGSDGGLAGFGGGLEMKRYLLRLEQSG
jgi:methylated-DNA-[protein]-cysteine S-methyltransferase